MGRWFRSPVRNLRSRGGWSGVVGDSGYGRGAVAGENGLAAGWGRCFVLPVAVFPLQDNYLVLARAFFPVLLAANWASVRTSLRSTALIPALLVVSAIAALPASGIAVVMGWESRATYSLALRQVEQLREYLEWYR